MRLRALYSQSKRLLSMKRAVVEADVLIVGGGPAGLSTAIRIKQLAPSTQVMVVEKGSAIGRDSHHRYPPPPIGSHIVSGAVMETRALDELFVDWRTSFPKDVSCHPI